MSIQTPTLAEWFSGHGFATGGFPGTSLVGSPQGFHRGFEIFDEGWTRDALLARDVAWRTGWHRTLQRAMDWLQTAREPFFLWLHYMDTHHLPQYSLPEHFRKAFSPRWQHYDGKISYADEACVGSLLRFLGDRGLVDRTLLVVFSDHGEELHADNRPLHDGALGDDVIRVPLIFRLPAGGGKPGLRVGQQVRLADLFPTLCDLTSLPCPPGLHGRSIGPLLRGGPDDGPRAAYLENWPKGWLGIRTPEWKLILRRSDPNQAPWPRAEVEGLYHLPTDPWEKLNVAEAHPGVLAELRTQCLSWAEGSAADPLGGPERTRVEWALSALGYL
jgi:arylsulfatase A-like enzyme